MFNLEKDTIENILKPYLKIELQKTNINNKEIIDVYYDKFKHIQEYIHEYFSIQKDLSIEYFINIHKLLYKNIQKASLIDIQGKIFEIKPGTFRQQEFYDNDEYINASKVVDIEKDLKEIILQYNKKEVKDRTDIVELYCKIIKVHPFDDGNGRIGGIISDIECIKNGLKKINILNIRQKNKAYLIYLVGVYHYTNLENKLNIILGKIDKFNEESNLENTTKDSFLLESTSGFKRKVLFSKFDEGIEIDEVGIYSVKFEKQALELSKKIDSNIILDCFGCVGGSAIAFARSGKKVISVELDKNRHEMAKNNAKIYGVEDKITFINGDIFDILPTLDFDAIYLDPPWGGVDYINKDKFSFDDFLVDCKKLINLALQKTDNIIFSFPVNFDFKELNKLDFNFHIEPVFLGTTKLYYDVFFNKDKNSFLNYKKSIVLAMTPYLLTSLKKIPFNKYIISKEMFSNHMSLITEFSIENIVKKELDEENIKKLHKMLYPTGYKEEMEIDGLGKVVFMIPGEYKIYPNVGINKNNNNDFLYITPENVEFEMKKLIINFNEKINIEKNKEDLILEFFCKFSYIHPFADGNGRVGFILSDLLALKYLQKPLYLSRLKEIDKINFYKALKYYDEYKDLSKLKEVLDNNKDYLKNGNTLSYDLIGENFENYLLNTNEKNILIDKIGEKLLKFNKNIIFTDVGAGSGIVAKGILEKFNKKIDIYNFVEPSIDFVGNFASKSKFNNIVYLNNKIENYDDIGNSDFIILIHSSQYINNLKDNIEKLYNSLNFGGILLIVNWDKESADYKIKKQLYGEMFDVSENIEKNLLELNINYKKEKINTKVFGIREIEKLDKNAKNLCSFLSHKPFEIIEKHELNLLIEKIKLNSKGDFLENIENYFWIEKNKKN